MLLKFFPLMDWCGLLTLMRTTIKERRTFTIHIQEKWWNLWSKWRLLRSHFICISWSPPLFRSYQRREWERNEAGCFWLNIPLIFHLSVPMMVHTSINVGSYLICLEEILLVHGEKNSFLKFYSKFKDEKHKPRLVIWYLLLC